MDRVSLNVSSMRVRPGPVCPAGPCASFLFGCDGAATVWEGFVFFQFSEAPDSRYSITVSSCRFSKKYIRICISGVFVILNVLRLLFFRNCFASDGALPETPGKRALEGASLKKHRTQNVQ
uniref:Uncharacterized protein n=1 Tax=Anopheles farauti TaxID=69004 RepID=A0A182QXV8_9DIPT